MLRPGDANEVVEAWKVIMKLHHEPVALVLSRQELPTLDRSKYAPASGTAKGAYVLADAAGGKPDVILMATGSEVSLCLEAYEQLTAEGYLESANGSGTRVSSRLPSEGSAKSSNGKPRPTLDAPRLSRRGETIERHGSSFARMSRGLRPFRAHVPAIDEYVPAHDLLQAREIELAELVPLGY